MGMLDTIKDAKDIPAAVPLEVPEWGVVLHLRLPPADEYFDYQELLLAVNNGKRPFRDAQIEYLRMVAADENGVRIFKTDEGFDVLKSKSGKVVSRVCSDAAVALKDPLLMDEEVAEEAQEDFTETKSS
jgi:hypothetical protein